MVPKLFSSVSYKISVFLLLIFQCRSPHLRESETVTAMEAYSVKTEAGTKETASSANDTSTATIQQMLASSGALMSPLHFLPSNDGSSATLPWAMMPQYQMMVVPQSLLSAQGVTTSVSDGHVIFTPTMTTSSGEAVKGVTMGGQSVASILQQHERNLVSNSASPQPDLLRQYFADGSVVNTGHDQSVNARKQPKKPLTPYMTFSKMVSNSYIHGMKLMIDC